jgi:aminopeptidase YwaD
MNHCRERPGLPSVDVSERVKEALPGARVSLDIPLVDQVAQSAGNVVVRIGEGPLGLVLCAHYDHVGALADGRHFPGASDNAVAVSALLEVARVLAAAPPRAVSVAVVFAAAEELGMLGAARYAATVADPSVIVNVDDFAGQGEDPLWLLASPDFPSECLTSADRELVGAPLRVAPLPVVGFSDHVPFLERGLRRVAALSRRAAGPERAHTLLDTPDRISEGSVRAVGRALLLLAGRTGGCADVSARGPDATTP